MIDVSKELKEAFLSAEQKNLVLTFDDGTVVDNEDIALESMELEQTLCDSDELKFGKVSSACFKTKIAVSTKTYKNLWFHASIGVGEYEIQLGRFKVYTDNMTSDRMYREIVAYDSLFWAINTDVTEWYNGLAFPVSQKAFRDSLFAHLGIEQDEVELSNDSIMFNRTMNAENLTGLTVLQKLCEINAAWGVINNAGKFKYVHTRTHGQDALYPSDDLYPSDALFPNDIYDDSLSKSDYYQGSLTYEEFDVQAISKVTIREDSEDGGYSYGVDGNTYVIEDNFLLYGATDSVLQTVAENFYDYASFMSYTPSQLKCKGAPWREVGDLLRVIADKRTLTVPILNRQLSGITALNDTYTAKGTETYGEVKNSPSEQLKQLQSRTNKLTRTLDETRLEISKVETNLEDNYSTTTEMNSAISQTAESVTSTVSETYETIENAGRIYNNLQTQITQNASQIELKVSQDNYNGGQIVSRINQTAESVAIDANKINLNGVVTANEFFKINEDGSMETVSGKIANWDIKTDYLGSFGAADDTLFLSQTGKNAYVNTLESAKDCYVYVKGNFAVDTTGVLHATGANISGIITASSGAIGGWNVYSTGVLGSACKNSSDGLYYGIGLDPNMSAFSGERKVFAIGQLGDSSSTTEQSAVEGAWGNAAFYVKANGSVVANNLSTNNINATGGTIGGWEITDTYLGGKSGEYTVRLYPNGYPYDGTIFFLVVFKYGTGIPKGGITPSGWVDIA